MYAVRDRMTPQVITVAPSDALAVAHELLLTARVRHLPVVQDGKLVGILTQRDLIRASSNLPPALTRGVPVEEVMQKKVLTVRPNTPLRRAARLMLTRKIGCLPVVNQAGALVGILTEADLAELAEELISELDRVTVPLHQLGRE